MATDPFDTLRTRLTDHVTHRRTLGILGLLGLATVASPSEASAKKKRKKKKKKKAKATTPAPTTSTTTTRTPGTCGAAGSNCGNAQTPCFCAASPTDLQNVRCISLAGFTIQECLADSECTDGRVCILDQFQIGTACAALCSL